MKQYQDELTRLFPVRRSAEEKAAFRAWAQEEISGLGFRVRVEENGAGRHQNLVVGDPQKAPVLFTAHYDTPGRALLPSPVMPRNLPLFFLYHLLITVVLMLVAALVLPLVNGLTGNVMLARLMWIAAYFALLLLMKNGVTASKHNANNNTSGVATLLEMMAALPEEDRSKAAFILFDNGEKLFTGSKAYAKDNLQVAYTRMTVNLDCVGAGDHLLVVSKNLARRQLAFGPLQRALEKLTDRQVHFFDSKGGVSDSDDKHFKSSVSLCACRKTPIVGYHVPSARTPAAPGALPQLLAEYVRGLSV